MLTLSEFDTFSKKYLLDWEQRSTVRTGKRSRLNKEVISKVEFSLHLKPFLQYPEIRAFTPEELHPYYLQALCDMLYGVAHFEVDFVTDQCGKLANKDLGIELSAAIKQVAIAIGTDEMYHAFAARELLADIEEFTGVIPTVLQQSTQEQPQQVLAESDPKVEPRLMPLEYFKTSVPPALERIAETTFLCILENAVVDDLFEMAKDFEVVNPVAVYNREHIQDEGRHKVFFQRLLKYIWGAISEEDRVVLGKAIAGYFKKYMSHSREELERAFSKSLQKLPLSESAIQSIAAQVANEMLAKPFYQKDFTKNPMHLMGFAGVTEHAPTRELFLNLGLLAESLELA